MTIHWGAHNRECGSTWKLHRRRKGFDIERGMNILERKGGERKSERGRNGEGRVMKNIPSILIISKGL